MSDIRTDQGRRECSACGCVFTLWGPEFRCSCGAPLDWIDLRPEAAGIPSGPGLWRRADLLPPVAQSHRVTLGEPVTPILDHDGFLLKLDYLLPTGSFKDRGAAVLASCALELGAREAIADSSGNAGAALAAYFAAAGIPLRVYVPRGASSPKVRQARRYGAEVLEVDGDRAAVSAAARAEAEHRGAFYASHAWSPFFVAGQRTLAAEIVEQHGPALPPVVVPVGAGTALLGLFQGFKALQRRGVLPALPRLIAVQAANCAPIAAAFDAGRDEPDPSQAWRPSVAEGINIGNPPRGRLILAAIRETGGMAVTVTEEAIVTAQAALSRTGVLVERTSAAAWAAAPAAGAGAIVVLTGSGLKEG